MPEVIGRAVLPRRAIGPLAEARRSLLPLGSPLLRMSYPAALPFRISVKARLSN
ncbi:MAG: hypothetical protein ABI409_05030 [Ramlibacter sp.]